MKVQMQKQKLRLNYKRQRLFSDKDHFTMYEFSQLLKTVQKSYRYEYVIWLKAIYHFGLSMSEFISLKANSLDLDNMILKIRSNKRLPGDIEVPEMLVQDIKFIQCSKKDTDYLFNVRENRPIHASTLNKFFKKIYRQTGQTINIQKIRRSLAIHLLELNWSFKGVREFLRLRSNNSLKKLIGKLEFDDPRRRNIFPIDQICKYY